MARKVFVSNRPRDGAYIQQTYRAFRPEYTFKKCLLLNVALGALCIVLSVAIFLASFDEHELVIDYTNCAANADVRNGDYLGISASTCLIDFNIDDGDQFEGDVEFYYGLSGFYQNALTYFRSRDDYQLLGDVERTPKCGAPYRTVDQGNGTELPIVPCGAVADSLFNDTFILFHHTTTSKTPIVVPMRVDDDLVTSLRQRKYRNPIPCASDRKCAGFENTTKPLSWRRPIAELGDSRTGRALENFDFIMWMEVAMLPKFRKHYRVLDCGIGEENMADEELEDSEKTDTNVFKNGLPAGNYTLQVEKHFGASSYGAQQYFVIVRRGRLLSGRNTGGNGMAAKFQAAIFLMLGIFFSAFSLAACLPTGAYRQNQRIHGINLDVSNGKR